MSVPISRCRATEPVTKSDLTRDHSNILCHRHTFARERRLCHLQRNGFDQSRVSRRCIALFEENDVARHEGSRWDALLNAVSNDIGVCRRHPAQLSHRLLRAGLLEVAHERIENNNSDNGQCFVRQGRFALV